MPILTGQIVTADDLNHLKPTTYHQDATSNLAGVVVNTDVPGATITFDTETDNAVYVAEGNFDMDWQGAAAAGAVMIGRLSVDGVIATGDVNVEQAAGANGDRLGGATRTWRGTLATAGSHTIKLVASVPDADQRVTSPHTGLTVTIYEVV